MQIERSKVGTHSLHSSQQKNATLTMNLRLTIAFKGELDDWLSRYQSLTLVPLDAGC
jgi:hypothetical protein